MDNWIRRVIRRMRQGAWLTLCYCILRPFYRYKDRRDRRLDNDAWMCPKCHKQYGATSRGMMVGLPLPSSDKYSRTYECPNCVFEYLRYGKWTETSEDSPKFKNLSKQWGYRVAFEEGQGTRNESWLEVFMPC